MQQPPMPPNVQQTPDGTSYDVAQGGAGGQPKCTKLEIIPPQGGAPGGGGAFTVHCFLANNPQPQTATASTPDELIHLIGAALGLAPPTPTPSDATAESATAPAAPGGVDY